VKLGTAFPPDWVLYFRGRLVVEGPSAAAPAARHHRALGFSYPQPVSSRKLQISVVVVTSVQGFRGDVDSPFSGESS
jgi:hypothetical protein